MPGRFPIMLLLCLLPSLNLNGQELRRIHPVKATASSYYKDLNLQVHRSYQKYAKYFRDNSPEKAFDGDKQSSWVTDGRVEGSWIELEFPYPVNVSKISVLGGCHVNEACYDINKKIRKFQVIDEHGESKKLTIKEPAEPTEFDLEFKKASRTLRFKILNLSGETPRNKDYTIGFAEIFVGHMTYTSPDLKEAVMNKNMDLLKKAIKSARKKVRNPFAILTGGQDALEMATEDGSKELAFELWKNGFRFHAGSTEKYIHITTKALLEDHFQQVDRVNREIDDLITRLNDQDFEASWDFLNKVIDAEANEYKFGDFKQKKVLHDLALERRRFAAQKILEQKIEVISKDSPDSKNLGLLFNLAKNEETLYQALNDVTFPLVENVRREALNKMLKSILSEDLANMEALPDQLSSIPTLRSINDDFTKTYARYRKSKAYQLFAESVRQKKTQIVSNSEQEIKDYIDKQSTSNRMDYVRTYYLSEVNDTRSIGELRDYVKVKKEQLIAEKAIKAAEAKAEEEKQVAAARGLIYKMSLDNSKRVITDAEWQRIINDAKSDINGNFTYYSVDDLNVESLFTAYLSNLDNNSFYMHNSANNKSTEIVNSRNTQGKMAFQTGQEIDSYWDSNSASIRYRSRPKVTKVVNSNFWNLAQRCQSVKNYLETTSYTDMKVIGMRIHNETGLPLTWTTSLVESTCVQRGAYDNCTLPCTRRVEAGSDNYYFYVSDHVYRWNTSN